MDFLFGEIRKALDKELYYAALLMALALPDICAALETGNGRTSRALYKHWLETNMFAGKKTTLTADALYQFRCGIVQRTNIPGKPRFIFAVHPTGKFDENYLFGARSEVLYDLKIICNEIITAAKSWFDVHKDDSNVRKNLQNVVKARALNIQGTTVPVIF
jgi:hypothetical protein